MQRGWLAEEVLLTLKLVGPSAVTLYRCSYHHTYDSYLLIAPLHRKHRRLGVKTWVKVTPLGKEATSGVLEPGCEDSASVDLTEARARRGGWPVVEAAVCQVFLTYGQMNAACMHAFLRNLYLGCS